MINKEITERLTSFYEVHEIYWCHESRSQELWGIIEEYPVFACNQSGNYYFIPQTKEVVTLGRSGADTIKHVGNGWYNWRGFVFKTESLIFEGDFKCFAEVAIEDDVLYAFGKNDEFGDPNTEFVITEHFEINVNIGVYQAPKSYPKYDYNKD